MRITRCAVSVLAVVLLVAGASWSAGRVGVDPNAAPKTETPAPADARLDQKITYDSGYARLHTITDDLTRMTGVKILSGTGKNNWPVRDIPLVVCVKDMPLGKLLRAIADATHTSLGCEKTADDPKKFYRIHRTSAAQTDIDTYFVRRRENQLAIAKWQWDAMAACGKSDTKPKNLGDHEWAVARLVAAMGPQARDQVLAGDIVEPDPTNSTVERSRDAMYSEWKQVRIVGLVGEPRGGSQPEEFDPSKAREAKLSTKIQYGGDTGRTQIEVSIRDSSGGSSSYLDMAGYVRDKVEVKDLPPYPGDFATPSPRDDMANPDMTFLRTGMDSDMDRPLLKAKIDVVKPADIKKPVFADLIRAVAQASGLNIVTEDFSSHQSADGADDYARSLAGASGDYGSVDKLFAKDTDVTTILRNLRVGKNYYWFIDESNKLLLGWNQGSREAGWRGEHRNLLSESYINDLRAKVKGKGAEMDDVVHLVSISRESLADWIVLDHDLTCLANIQRCAEPELWQLYDSLSSADKLRARSENGLPFSSIDPEWLAAFFRECKLLNASGYYSNAASLDARAISDPTIISTMVLHVGAGGPVPSKNGAPERHDCTTWLEYKVDGEDRTASSELGGLQFPVWSAEREAELSKAAKQEDAAQQPKSRN